MNFKTKLVYLTLLMVSFADASETGRTDPNGHPIIGPQLTSPVAVNQPRDLQLHPPSKRQDYTLPAESLSQSEAKLESALLHTLIAKPDTTCAWKSLTVFSPFSESTTLSELSNSCQQSIKAGMVRCVFPEGSLVPEADLFVTCPTTLPDAKSCALDTKALSKSRLATK